MTYWYLASPYSKYPGGIESAYKMVCIEQARLIRAGIPVFCPIAHTHGAAVHGAIDPLAHSVWLPADEPFIRQSRGIIMLRAASWELSFGMREEHQAFTAARKSVVWMDPGTVPPELFSLTNH